MKRPLSLTKRPYQNSRGEVTLIETVVVIIGIFIVLVIVFSLLSLWLPAFALSPLKTLGLLLLSPLILFLYIVLIVIPLSNRE